MLMQPLTIIKLYMNCGIIAMAMGIILSIMGNFLLKSIIGNILSIIGLTLLTAEDRNFEDSSET